MKEFYGHTNESLWAVVAGMNVSRKDRVLCICSSGDQAFALAEYANKVVAVDRDVKQINYAKRRLEALRNKNYDDFFPLFNNKNFPMIKGEKFDTSLSKKEKLKYLNFMATIKSSERILATWSGSVRYFLGEKTPFLKCPYDVFSNEDKIHKIRENLERISFVQGDIINLLRKDNDFSRVYFSNALLSWEYNQGPKDKVLNQLSILPKDCLIYLTNANSEKRKFHSWKLEEELSRKAEKLELEHSWHPKVYRKIV